MSTVEIQEPTTKSCCCSPGILVKERLKKKKKRPLDKKIRYLKEIKKKNDSYFNCNGQERACEDHLNWKLKDEG